jgi:hypothetical protein
MALDELEKESDTTAQPTEREYSAAFEQVNTVAKNPQTAAGYQQLNEIVQKSELLNEEEPEDNYQPQKVSNVNKQYKSVPSNQNGSGGRKTAGIAAQGSGLALQGTGAVVQGTGKVISGVSRGAAVIPVVGAPIAAVGTGIGKGFEGAGKGMKRGGKVVKRAGSVARRNPPKKSIVNKAMRLNPAMNILQRRLERRQLSIPDERAEVAAAAKSSSKFLIIIGWIVAFPIAIFNALFIYFFNAFMQVKDGGLWDITKSAITLNFAEAALKTGFYLNSDTLMGFMVFCYAAGFALAASFLFIALSKLSRSGAKTKNSAIKTGLFLTALVAAFIPMANVWPWANTWIRHVGKHPE